MIISHTHRFIFIKTRKTAGSSAEIALSRLCGPGDVLTPLSEVRAEEQVREQETGLRAQNYHKRASQHRGWQEWRRLLLQGRRAEWRRHETAEALRRLLGRDIWDCYWKVSIERNPWDRAVSRYFYDLEKRRGRGEEASDEGLSDFLAWCARHKPIWLSNWDHYAINGQVAVDEVFFFEDLDAHLRAFGERLGYEGELGLPSFRAKSGFRDQRQYSEILTARDRELVAEVCRREIEAFGYRF